MARPNNKNSPFKMNKPTTLYDFTGRRAQTQTTQNPRLGQINTDATRRSAPGQDTPTSVGAGPPLQSLSPENPRATGPSEMQRSDPNTQFSQFPGAQGQAPQSSFRQGGQANTRAEQLAMREASKRFVGSGGVGGAWHRYGGPAAQDLQTPPGFQPYHAPTTLGRFINPAIQLPQDIYQRMHGTQAAAAAQGDVPGMIAQGADFGAAGIDPASYKRIKGRGQRRAGRVAPAVEPRPGDQQVVEEAAPKTMEGIRGKKVAPTLDEPRTDAQTDRPSGAAGVVWDVSGGRTTNYDELTEAEKVQHRQRTEGGQLGHGGQKDPDVPTPVPSQKSPDQIAADSGIPVDTVNKLQNSGYTVGDDNIVRDQRGNEYGDIAGLTDEQINDMTTGAAKDITQDSGPKEAGRTLLDEILALEKPEGIDTAAMEAALRDRSAVAQSRAAQIAASSAARTGMAPEAAAGMQAGLAQQMGAETAFQATQQRLQGDMANMQQEMSFYKEQADALFQQAQFEQDDQVRKEMLQNALRLGQLAHSREQEMTRLRHELENEVTASDVFGGVLGGIVSPFFGGLFS